MTNLSYLYTLLTLQCVSWISSCWNIYAVMKQNTSDISGKPTVARHNFLNDTARCMELLLLPTLFSSILAALSSILAFVRKSTIYIKAESSQTIVRYRFMLHSGSSIRWFLVLNYMLQHPWDRNRRNHRLSLIHAHLMTLLNCSLINITRNGGSCLRKKRHSLLCKYAGSNCEPDNTSIAKFLDRDKSAQRVHW